MTTLGTDEVNSWTRGEERQDMEERKSGGERSGHVEAQARLRRGTNAAKGAACLAGPRLQPVP